MKNKLTYDKIIELVNLGRELCPYVRNPTMDRGACALTQEWSRCKHPFRPDYKECRYYKESSLCK